MNQIGDRLFTAKFGNHNRDEAAAGRKARLANSKSANAEIRTTCITCGCVSHLHSSTNAGGSETL